MNITHAYRMKKAVSAIVLLVFCLTITACDSANTKKAKDAYEAGSYSEVISVLKDEQDLDEATTKILSISRAHVAFDAGDYLDAMTELMMVKDEETDLYHDTVEKLVEKAVESSSEEELLKGMELDPSIAGIAAEAIEKRCDALSYDAFKFMDRLLEDMPETEGRAELQEYRDKNQLNRAKAFLLGKWEWQSAGEVKTSVSCVRHKDNLIATVDVVGDIELDYKIMKDDVYWKDFEFVEADRFTCTCLCKTGDGVGVECTTVGTINYGDDTLHMHLTAPAPYWMNEESSDRDWRRIPE